MRNRYLLWFGFSFFAIVAMAASCRSILHIIACAVLFFAVIVFLLLKPELRLNAVIVTGAVLLSFIWQTVYYNLAIPASYLVGNDIPVIAEATSYSKRNNNDTGMSVKVKLRSTEPGKTRSLRAILYINGYDFEVSPGDRIYAIVNTEEPENTEYFAQKTYYKTRYIDAIGYTNQVNFIDASDGLKIKYLPQYLSEKVSRKFDEIFDEECAAFFRALILGDQDGISESLSDDMRKVGILHIVSVSGMHISAIIGFIIIFTKDKYLRLLAIPVIILFALMVGASQSALRAVIMQTILLLSTVVKREYDMLTSLAASGLILVAVNPYCASDTGFLLSYSATLGIILLAPKMSRVINRLGKDANHYVRRIINFFAATISVSVAAFLFTTPVLLLSFGYFSVVSPIANILLNVFITICFVGGIMVVVLGMINAPLAKIVSFVIIYVYKIIRWVVQLLAGIPFAEVYVGNNIFVALVLFLCFVIVYAVAFGRRKVRIGISVAVIAISICMTLAVSVFLNANETTKGVRFDILDVGQGQCIVAEFDEMCVVIDCGGSKDAGSIAVKHLRERSVSEIDALILTHAHSDHVNGAEYLVKTMPTEAVYAPISDKDEVLFSDIGKNDENSKTQIKFIDKDTELVFSDIKINLFALPHENTQNENGLVIVISDGEFDFIVTGDVPGSSEAVLTREKKLPDCEVYVVGHHGSSTSSSQQFLNTILPEISVISVGEGNTYNHPTDQTLLKLSNIGSEIYRTDKDGDVTVYSRG